MIKIIADASLPYLSDFFDTSVFSLSLYHDVSELKSQIKDQNILLCRANLHVNEALIEGTTIQCIASASSGTCHIESKRFKDKGISVLDAKGCNAVSVGDYIISCLAHLIRNNKLQGYQFGLIGYGEVGQRLYPRLQALGFNVKVVDPFKQNNNPKVNFVELLELLDCDVISIHANYHHELPYSTHHLLSYDFFSQMKMGSVLINAARGKIVDEKALLSFPPHFLYCADVFQNEPHLNAALVKRAEIATPHIAGHSLDAKRNAIKNVATAIYNYLGLKLPLFESLSPNIAYVKNKRSWVDEVLSLYDPLIETQKLKQAQNLEGEFLTLRKNHVFRRDFYTDGA